MRKDPKRFKVTPVIVPLFVPMPAIKKAVVDNPVIESDEDRWSREYDEENDPDPWGDQDDRSCSEGDFDDSVEDWELLGMDPESSQEEIDTMWDNQM